MVKYGKKFRESKIKEWEDKYFNYKKLKQKIKKFHSEKQENNLDELNDIEKSEILDKWIKSFTDDLNTEIRNVYVFFSKKEKALYKDINVYLHIKDDYMNYTLEDYLKQYQELKNLSILSLNMSNYVYVNFQALMKILKKFDKKIIGPNKKDDHIKNSYIISKLEEQNSDVLYLINFKMIDEVNVILEDLIKCLKEQFKKNKNEFKSSYIEYVTDDDDGNNENGENLITNRIDMVKASDIMDDYYKQIISNVKKIDKIANDITKLFLPWKKFLRISGDVSSRLIQLSKEMNLYDSMGEESRTFRNNRSIVDTLSFSKQSKLNIRIILCHAFLYMYSFSVIIPLYPQLISSDFWNVTDKYNFYYGFLMMMVPIGTSISFFYESNLFKLTTKKPLVASSIGLVIGNILYHVSIYINPFVLLFLARFLIGLFNLRAHNKMYIINFLLKKDISFYLTLFHTFSLFGLACGFLINIGLVYLPENSKFLNRYTSGALLGAFLCISLVLLTSKYFTEARSNNFNITSMKSFSSMNKSFGKKDENNEKNETVENVDPNMSNLILEEGTNEELNEDLKNKTIMVNDINEQLGDFNRMSKYNDTNLVNLSITEIADKEKEGLRSLFSSFLVYLFIIFTTKYINESIFLNLPIFINKEINQLVIPLVFGLSCLIVLMIEFMLRNKNKIISEKNLLILLFPLNLLNDFILIFLRNNYNFLFFILIGLSIILINIIEKYSTHFFYSVIPEDYIICKMQGNNFINVFSMLAKIIVSILIIVLGNNETYYKLIVYISFNVLNLICLVLFLLFYSDIRIKSISRILNKLGKDDVKVATEV